MTDIPRYLQRQGVTEALDNVPEGHGVQVPSHFFSVLFRTELLKQLTANPAPANATKSGSES